MLLSLAFLFFLPLLAQGAVLQLSSPFLPCGVDTTRKGECLLLDPEVYAKLSALPVDGEVEFTGFPLTAARTGHLTLTRFTASTEQKDLPLVVLLRGRAFENAAARMAAKNAFDLIPSSTVFLGLSPFGGSHGYAEFGNVTYMISTPRRSVNGDDLLMDSYVDELANAARKAHGEAALNFGQGASIIFPTSVLTNSPPMNRFEPMYPPQEVIDETDRKIAANRAAPKDKKMRKSFHLASDADYQMFQKFGNNADNVAGYYFILVGQAATVYARDFGSNFYSNYLAVYTTTDPYPYDAGGCLEYMRTHWGSSPSRAVAALVSAKNLGGGVAYVRTLCNTAWAYAVNGNINGYFPTPLTNYHNDNWDIYVFMHEVGHVWGASHTHDLNPPADTCGSTPGCGSTQGSIMSYCHGCSGGMSNIYLAFHQYSINEVRPFIDSINC